MCNPTSLLGNGNVIAARNTRVTNVGRVLFYADRVVSKGGNRLALRRNCFKIHIKDAVV
jgi:hypothetical protein